MAKKAAAKRQPPAASERPATRVSATAESPALPAPRPEPGTGRWTFLTNHSHVMILLSRYPSMVLREVAMQVGITERAVQRIIADLEDEGFIEREKVGRQNHYRILTSQRLRHPIEAHCTIGDLLLLINDRL
ncbi:MAG: MarR family transcriptional regulator [Planctomycetales bacterium]|nr:MarR family transcriptional regulator [Planctomycetales bacterium]